MELTEAIKMLADERITENECRKQRADLVAAVTESTDYKFLTEREQESKRTIEELTGIIHEHAKEIYGTTGNKNPHEAVQVKIFSVVSIPDEVKARDWCLSNFTPCLKLDTKQFEKAAEAKQVPAELATVSTEPRAQIAKDLSKYA